MQAKVLKYHSKVVFDNYASFYNDSKLYNREKLKSGHVQLYKILIDNAYRTFEVKKDINPNFSYNPDDFYIVLKPSYLKKAMKCVLNTAKTRLERLEESGVVRVESFKNDQSYCIYFAPELLLVASDQTPDPYKNHIFRKRIKYNKLDFNGCQNLTPSIIVQKFKRIKETNDVKGVENFETNNLEKFQKQMFKISNENKSAPPRQDSNTESRKKTPETPKQNEKNTPPTPKAPAPLKFRDEMQKHENKLENLRQVSAFNLLMLAVQLLWAGREVLDEEFNKALKYIKSSYYDHLQGVYEIENFEAKAMKVIEKAGKYCEDPKNNYQIACYPRKYFDTGFKYGFYNWLKNSEIKQKKKQQSDLKHEERKAVLTIYKSFARSKDLGAFKASSDYIQKMMPEYQDDFSRLVANNYNNTQINNYLTKEMFN